MHCCSNCACGLPLAGGMSLVAESGWFGLTVLPPLVVAVVLDVVDVVAGAVVVVNPGEVTAGIETGAVVVPPESSPPQPAAISPMARASGMTRIKRIR